MLIQIGIAFMINRIFHGGQRNRLGGGCREGGGESNLDFDMKNQIGSAFMINAYFGVR